jgi:hypothetical protein
MKRLTVGFFGAVGGVVLSLGMSVWHEVQAYRVRSAPQPLALPAPALSAGTPVLSQPPQNSQQNAQATGAIPAPALEAPAKK